MHVATKDVPPGEIAVIVVPTMVATAGFVLMIVSEGSDPLAKPFSSERSAWTVTVRGVGVGEMRGSAKVVLVVRFPGVSPGTCSRISIGMQVRNPIAGPKIVAPEAEIEAESPVVPGLCAVAKPFTSTLATCARSDTQLKEPTSSDGISTPLSNACAWNWRVSVVDVQGPAPRSASLTDVTFGCRVTATGLLVTPWSLAKMLTGVPAVVSTLPGEHTIKRESQMPPHTSPAGETVTREGFEEVHVTAAGFAETCITSPGLRETKDGDTVMVGFGVVTVPCP